MSKVKSTLTAEQLRELLHYDPETGVFTRLVAPRNRRDRPIGSIAGTPAITGYIMIGIGQDRYYAHRLAWLYMTGDWPVAEIDHIDGNRSNNRFSNLRDTPRSMNSQNVRGARKDNKSGILGVCQTRPNWFRAEISVDGRRIHIGTFRTAQEASDAYMKKKRELHIGNTL